MDKLETFNLREELPIIPELQESLYTSKLTDCFSNNPIKKEIEYNSTKCSENVIEVSMMNINMNYEWIEINNNVSEIEIKIHTNDFVIVKDYLIK